MNCLKAQSLLSEYLDGDLDAERTEGLERHLAYCPACASEWHGLHATVRLVGHLGRQECPVDLRAAVMRAVTIAPPKPSRPPLFQRALAVCVGGSAVLACLSLPVVLQRATLQSGGSFSSMLRPTAQPSLAPVHTEYDMATILGPTDGLLLAMPARSEAGPGNNAQDEAP